MKIYENPKNYYNAIKLAGQTLAVWPLKTGASGIEVLFHEVKWWLTFLNIVSSITPLILGVYCFRNDFVSLTKALSELTTAFEFFVNLIQFKTQNYNFQVILEKMGDFIRNSNKYEEQLFQKYIDKYKSFQQFLGLSFLICAFLFACMPILTSQPLPVDGWYPFSLESHTIHTTLYISQVISIAQIGSGFIIDFIIAAMLMFCSVKVDLLRNLIREAKGKTDIKYCAYQHQQLILYAGRVQKGIQYIILKTNLTMTMAVICGGYQLINHEPFEVVIRFMLIVVAGSLKLYVSAKPADDLKENSELLAQTAFLAASNQETPSDARLALMLAHRCQKPIIISVKGIIKAYCLEYYGLFLSTLVKYFLNLRALLN